MPDRVPARPPRVDDHATPAPRPAVAARMRALAHAACSRARDARTWTHARLGPLSAHARACLPRSRADVRRLLVGWWAAGRRWFLANTFTPAWQTGRWARPAVVYALAVISQVVATALTLALGQDAALRALPTAFMLLAVVLAALTWGAAPGLIATVAGAALLDYFILPPRFTIRPHRTDLPGLLLIVLVGCAMTIAASQTERARRRAEALGAHLDAVIEAVPAIVVVHDAQGALTRINEAGRPRQALDGATALADMPDAYALRAADGTPLTAAQLPVTRALRGERVAGIELRGPGGDAQERYLLTGSAPVRDGRGRIVGAVSIAHDVTERHLLQVRTRQALDALVAMAEALVDVPPRPGPAPDAVAAVGAGGAARAGDVAPPDAGEAGDEWDGVDGAAPAARPAPPDAAARSAVARRLAALTCSVLDCRRVGIVAIDPETRLVRPVAVVGRSAERERRWWAEQEQQQVRFGEGADPALVERFAAGETLVGGAWPAPDGVATGLFVPLRLGETLIGMLSLDFGDAPHGFTADERALAATVAKLAALVLERERLLREREQARAGELAQREANRRMDLFLGMASHELKTPITALLVNLQMVARRLYPSLPRAARYEPAAALDAARTQLDRAEHAVRRLDRLVGDLLDASRVREDRLAFRPAPCDLLAIVRDAVEEQRQIAPGRQIALDAPSLPALPLFADADRIGQVVTNYLTNALKYSAPGRPVTVTVTPDGPRARVAVRDKGPGLPPVEQERVWERFHRAPDVSVLSGSGVGLGLGLYITRTVVEWHGGRVGVESAPGRGSTFWFEIPLAAAGEAGEAGDAPAGGHGRPAAGGAEPGGASA